MEKSIFKSLFSLTLTLILSILGGGSVMMAAADLPDAGKTNTGAGDNTTKGDGAGTLTADITDGDVDFLDKEIDRKITKIRPMSTPIDQISRYAESGSSKQMDFKYFSIGTRPIKTTVKNDFAVPASSSAVAWKLDVTDPSIFTVDDTIRVVGVSAVTDYKGSAYNPANGVVPDLILKVTSIADDGNPMVHAVNGNLIGGQAIKVPNIKKDNVLIRLGKACGELDVQTGRFANIPTAEVQYCQNFMMQVEQSTFDKISEKNVDWNFTDLEEDAVYDMRLGMEGSFLFGDKGKIVHASKNNMATWFTGGIWWKAGKNITLGHYDSTSRKAVISDDDLVDFSKDLFVGTGCGNKRKVMTCGSDVLAALSKIQSDKFRLKDTVEVWNLKFKSWDTDFGEILTIHHEFFDLNGMAGNAFVLDPDFIGKKKFLSWTRTVLDLKSAGVRNTDAVVLQEASALYLRYPKAHARVALATA